MKLFGRKKERRDRERGLLRDEKGEFVDRVVITSCIALALVGACLLFADDITSAFGTLGGRTMDVAGGGTGMGGGGGGGVPAPAPGGGGGLPPLTDI